MMKAYHLMEVSTSPPQWRRPVASQDLHDILILGVFHAKSIFLVFSSYKCKLIIGQ